MSNKAIVWIREDFRINNNPALAYASHQHNLVSALYIFNPKVFIKKREAQQWWLSKSLENFKVELSKLNINLEIQIGEEMDILSKINSKDNLTIYWNKVYEPDVINLGKKIRDNIFLKKNIKFKYFKGNILNEFQNVTKKDETPFKVFTPFWRVAEQIYINAIPSKLSKVLKREKSFEYFKNNRLPEAILPKKKMV
jgi:deoxyribodipyrimidine photo-lyase